MELFGKRNEAMFDEWSIVHVASGIIFSQSGFLSFPAFIAAHTLLELWENSKEGNAVWKKFGWHRYRGDTLGNTLGDTLSAAAGFWLGEMRK